MKARRRRRYRFVQPDTPLSQVQEGALSRIPSRKGFVGQWRKICRAIYSPRVLDGLPPFAEKLAKTFWDIDPTEVIRAIRRGDVALFVAFKLRLDQIDCAMVDLERSLAERAPVIRSKFMVEGFRLAAVHFLQEHGGVWPPQVTTADDEGAEAEDTDS